MSIRNSTNVNQRLTPQRVSRPARIGHRRTVENDDYAAFSARIVAAHGRRIATGDIEGLTDLAHLADLVDNALQQAITGLRATGYSWTDIGTRLGITRQAVHQRFSHHNDHNHHHRDDCSDRGGEGS